MSDYLQRARLLIEQGRFAEAEGELAFALGEHPDDGCAHGLIALCLAHRQDYRAATQHAEQGVALTPDAAVAHRVLAMVLFSRNDLRRAQAAAGESLALDPFDPDLHLLMGRIHFAQEQWKDALEAARSSLALDAEGVNALNLEAERLRKLGYDQSAQGQLRAALAVDPQNAETHASLGWLALQDGHRDEAKRHFREALRLDPELESARAGVLAAINAWNPVYRLLLKYIFWMQGLGRGGRWLVIIGAYFGYQVARGMAQANPAMAPLIWPLLAGYIAFVLLTWLGGPLANLSLRLHPFGRLALSRDERVGSNWIGGFLLGAVVCGLAAWLVDSALWLPAALFFATMLIPLAATFQAARPWPWKPLAIYSLITGVCGLVFAAGPFVAWLFAGLETAAIPLWKAVNGLCSVVFFLGIVMSFWAGNIFLSIRWRK